MNVRASVLLAGRPSALCRRCGTGRNWRHPIQHLTVEMTIPDTAARSASPSVASPVPARDLGAIPVRPLVAAVAVQALATMALFSIPTAAPEIARGLQLPGPLVGVFVSVVYGVGIGSSLLSPGFIHRYGPVRVSQTALIAVVVMLGVAASGGAVALAAGALVLGLAYGTIAPAGTHLLVPQTPRPVLNLMMALRQVGVPLGGALAAVSVPPMVASVGWRGTLWAEALPVVLLVLALQVAHRAWDTHLEPLWPVWGAHLLEPLRLLRSGTPLRILSMVGFVYSGVQVCFIVFMTLQLTTSVGESLARAGLALAIYQMAGMACRPVWGWVADRFLSPRRMLALLGAAMVVACLAAGSFGPGWSWYGVLAVAVLGGLTAGGVTGLLYAEFARLGRARRTEATGLGNAALFSGMMLIPPGFGAAVAASGEWFLPYAMLAALATAAVFLLRIRQSC